MKITSSAARWLFRAAAFPCLAVWLTVRLWIALRERLSYPVLSCLGIVLALPVLWCLAWSSTLLRDGFGRSKTETVLSRQSAGYAVLFGVSLVLGSVFDISYAMADADGLPIARACVRLFCHAGNGLVFAFLVSVLVRAAGSLRGLGRVGLRPFLAIAAALNAVTAVYVFTSRNVYVWDVAGYWCVARSLAEQPLSYSLLRGVLETTVTMDYNHLLAFPISLVMRLFGGSRAVYLFSVSNLYTLPAFWALLALGKEFQFSGLALCALSPMLVYMGLVGFVDPAACALALWAFVVYTSDRPAFSRGVMAGALLVGSFLLRRYFFFFAASFGVAAGMKKLLFERDDWRDFLALFLSSALCALSFTWSFLLDKVLGVDYADLYSAYALGLRNDFLLICRYFGLALLVVLFLFTLRHLVVGKDRSALLFPLMQVAVCFVAFVSVQTHGQQHLLLYLPGLAALTVLLFGRRAAGRRGTSQAWNRQHILAILSGCVLINCFIPKAQPASVEEIPYPSLLPSFLFYGTRRTDISELERLADYVDRLSAERQKTAVVLSSSFTFNAETLANLRPSLGLRPPNVTTVIQDHGTVDKRDPFNWNTAFADYLIIGDPVQVHLGEENQQIMALLARDVLEQTGPGLHYEAKPEIFSLQNGVSVRVFERVEDWSYDDFLMLSNRLTALYPDYADMYQLPAWITPS